MFLIKSTNLSNARLMDFYQVMTLTSGFLAKENATTLKLEDIKVEFNTSFESFEASLKQASKTGYTEALIAADDNRDNIVIGFIGTLNNYLRFPDKTISDAASALLTIIEKYGSGIARLPQREETAVLTNLIQDLRSKSSLLETVGLTAWVNKLEEANKAFEQLYSNRTEKESEFITGLSRTQRANLQATFEKLCRTIEAFAVVNGESAYRPLAEKINQAVADVQIAKKARTTMAENNSKKTKA